MNDYKLDLAHRYYLQGSYDSAIEMLKELLADDPNSPTYHGMLALNLIAQKRIHAAEFELNLALTQDPSLAFLYIVSAQVYIFKNKPNDALAQCDQALALEVDNTEALLLKSTLYKQLNQYEQALLCLDQAAQIEPNSCAIESAYGEYYFDKGDNNRAYEYATRALHLDPQDPDANLLMGNAQLNLNNIEEAEYHAKFVILQTPENRGALVLFANIKMRRNLIFGLWWRFSSAISNSSHVKSTIILIGAYLFFNLLAQIVHDLGHPKSSIIISYSWLAFVIYTWIGIPFYHRKLATELEKFTFNAKF